MPSFRMSGIVGIFVLMVGAPLASAQAVPVEKTPKPVMDAFKAKFPGFVVTAVKKETDEGKPAFEIESKKDGMTVDALLTPEGKFLAVEKEIKEGDLPAKVSAAVKAKYKNAKWTRIEEVTKDDTVSYEVALKKSGGESVVALITKDGKLTEEE